MAYGNFNSKLWARAYDDSNDYVSLGTMTFPKKIDLRYIVLHMFIKGSSNITSEQAYLTVHTSSNLNRVYATSNTISLSDVVSGSNFLMRLRFDFNGESINENTTYTIALKLLNYSKIGDTFWISTLYDLPYTIQELGSASTAVTINDYAKAMAVFGDV